MTDGEQLERAVLAAPEDDAPRLVYADWLQERGDERHLWLRGFDARLLTCRFATNGGALRYLPRVRVPYLPWMELHGECNRIFDENGKDPFELLGRVHALHIEYATLFDTIHGTPA